MSGLLLIVLVVVGGIVFVSLSQKRQNSAIDQRNQSQLGDAVADARRWIERLGSQVLSLSGTDTASTQALADASERYNAASSQISTASTVQQARLARESALEGLYFVNAAREIMGLPAGPQLPLLEGQKSAGSVTEERTIEHEGHTITASPVATAETPNYYPGGRVAGRPVPAGWYSEPWWQSALRTGLWTAGSLLMFNALFHGMSGIAYGANEFESGVGDGTEAVDSGDVSGDDFGGDDFSGGDAGDAGDVGGDSDGGFFDGFFDGGASGGDGGGLFDGGFDFDF